MRYALFSLFVFVLAACGGGGGGDDVPPATTVRVGGTLAGLAAGKTVTIADTSGQAATLSANGNYSLNLPIGTPYNLSVQTQPAGQTCVVVNGAGTATAAVDNITVTCTDNPVSPDAKPVAGTVAGMGPGKTVVLQLTTANGTVQETAVNADGSFQFPQSVIGTYTITVKTQPSGQSCTVANSQGTAGEGAAIAVSCAAAASSFRLGGSVTGNGGVVAFRNTVNGDTLVLNTNGAFSFTQPALAGGRYEVVVFDQSAGQTCSVTGGSGTANADVTHIQVSCSAIVAVAPPVPPGPPPVPAPTVPAGLSMTYGFKSFNLAWGTVTAPVGGGSVTYRLFEDPDGAGPMASAQIGGTLTGATYTQVVTGLLHTRLNARYSVQACNSVGCSSPTATVTPNLTQAIGYFKASNSAENDEFGMVALSADGSTLAVGASGEDSNATGINGNQASETANGSGAVYVFTRTGGSWSQQAYLKPSNTRSGMLFGESIALSANGGTLAVGAYMEDSGATGINGNQADLSAPDSGAVYVFTRAGTVWSQQAYVKASNAGAADLFGYRLALSGDGNTLAVGAPFEGSNATGIDGDQSDNSATNSGAVYVFTRAGTTWSQQAYVKTSNTGADDQFGLSVALSADGNTLAVGADQEDSSATGINGNQADNTATNSGAVYVFTRAGITWSQQAYVKASNTGANDGFGQSVALSADGSTLAVGAHREASSATGVGGNQGNGLNLSGAVYVFTRAGAAWSQQAYVKASNTGSGDSFGWHLALSGDGGTLAVGALAEGSNATGMGGDQADNSASFAGAVYVFTRAGTTWGQQAYVKSSNTRVQHRFGSSVSLTADGSLMAVGAYGESSNATGFGGDQADTSAAFSGAAFLY